MNQIMEIGDAIVWEDTSISSNLGQRLAGALLRSHSFKKVNEISKVDVQYKPGTDERMDKLTLLVFGECGTGKSTFLSLVSRIYTANYLGADQE